VPVLSVAGAGGASEFGMSTSAGIQEGRDIRVFVAEGTGIFVGVEAGGTASGAVGFLTMSGQVGLVTGAASGLPFSGAPAGMSDLAGVSLLVGA
jgi:hypothetical protein